MEHYGQLWRLKNLEWTACIDARYAQRQAVAIRVIDVITIPALLLNRRRPWRQLDIGRLEAAAREENQHGQHS